MATISEYNALTPSECSAAIRLAISVNLKNAAEGRARRPVFIWGPPGIGKSAIFKSIADEMGYRFIDIRLATKDPSDLSGLPMFEVTEEGKKVTSFAPPAEFLTGVKEKAIILLDELPNAPPAVQNAAYQIVLDGKINQTPLSPTVLVFAAGNRTSDRGQTFTMPVPLEARFIHLEMKPSYSEWEQYALATNHHPTVLGFLGAFKDKLNESVTATTSRGFANPRAWETVSDYLKMAESLARQAERSRNKKLTASADFEDGEDVAAGDSDDSSDGVAEAAAVTITENILAGLVTGALGVGIGGEFMAYRRNTVELPKIADILSGNVKKIVDRLDISVYYSLTYAMAGEMKIMTDELKAMKTGTKEYKTAKAKYDEAANNVCGFILENFQTELALLALRLMLKYYEIKMDMSLPNLVALLQKYSTQLRKTHTASISRGGR